MNEDQFAVAQFAADLAANLGYVDKQTTNRPSQQPPALRTDPKSFIKRLVQETRNVPNNQQQLAAQQQILQQAATVQVPQIPVEQATNAFVPQTPIVQPTVQLTSNSQQLEFSFEMNEKKELLQTLRSIDDTLKEVLVFLNENCTKKRRAGNQAGG